MNDIKIIHGKQGKDFFYGVIFPENPTTVHPCVHSPGTAFDYLDWERFCSFFEGHSPKSLAQWTEKKNNAVALAEVELLPFVMRPIHDIVCVGLNYVDHIAECDRGLDFVCPEEPTYFSKRASKIFTHKETLPSFTGIDDKLDYEVELAVMIGKKGMNIPPQEVRHHILGYGVFNDFSARTVQKASSQWVRGKGLDGLCAMGMELVWADSMEYPPKRAITSKVNGELRQNSMTDQVRHPLDYLISEFSKGCTLEPGDIIITGTPAGVAMGMDEPKYLQKGDVVRCEIEGISVLENVIG